MAAKVTKAMTKAQIVTTLSDDTGLSKKDITQVLSAQAELAYKQAKAGYTISGIGKLVIVARKARKGRNPATGEVINIPAKKVLKFRIAKAAKDAVGKLRAAGWTLVQISEYARQALDRLETVARRLEGM